MLIFSAWIDPGFFRCRKLPPSSKRRRLTYAICCWSSACTGSRWDLCGPSFQTTWKPSSPCVDLLDGRAPGRRSLETRRRPPESPVSAFVPAQILCCGSDSDILGSQDGPAPRRGTPREETHRRTPGALPLPCSLLTFCGQPSIRRCGASPSAAGRGSASRPKLRGCGVYSKTADEPGSMASHHLPSKS